MDHFALYVVDRTPRSERAKRNVKTLLEGALGEDYTLEIIDLLENPHAADEARVLLTPTLVRLSPSPERRVTGDFASRDGVRIALGLAAGGPGAR